MASVFFITNTFPVAAVIALTEGKQLRQVWTDCYSWAFPYYLVGAAVVAMFGFVNRTLSWQAWALIVPIVYAIYRSYYLYLERLENQRKRAEEEARHSAQVAQLLAQSMETNAALRRANEDLEQFAYAASHDLQEPLRMIAIYSQLLQRRHREAIGDDGKQLLDTITDGAQRINGLVADLLSYTRAAGPSNPTPGAVHPAQILREVEQALTERIVTLDAIITSDELLPVNVHRAHLVQLFQNLISNGLKYHSPEREPRIHISCGPAKGGMLEILVRDNGIGIDPAYHERIFGVFKRLHSRSVPGNGIGLAICKRIVQNYGGSIWVDSRLGEGSTFHVTLPAGASSAVEDLQARAESAATRKGTAPPKTGNRPPVRGTPPPTLQAVTQGAPRLNLVVPTT
jgi:signal transduction histidine kinase